MNLSYIITGTDCTEILEEPKNGAAACDGQKGRMKKTAFATNNILGFDETLKNETQNSMQADAAEAAKNGTLQTLVKKIISK